MKKWAAGLFVLTVVAIVALIILGWDKPSRRQALQNPKIASGANLSMWGSRRLNELLLHSRNPRVQHLARSWASVYDFDNSNPPHAMTDEEMHLLTAFPELRNLNLSTAAITDQGLASIRQLRHLETLSIRGTGITDAGLTNLSGFTKLQELFLQNTRVQGSGLSSLTNLPHLRVLRLDGLPIRDEHLRYLTPLSNLEKLDLGETHVSGEGLKYLADLTNLRSLSFRANSSLKNEGLRHLLPLYSSEPSGTNECHLLLGWTAIDDGAVETLKQFRRLSLLNLKSTRISAAGLKDLARTLVQTKIEFYPNQVGN